MSLDIRIPIGLLFCIIAAILMVYGVCTWGKGMYALSLGYNINLSWGGVLGIFGMAMLWLARRASRRKKGEDGRPPSGANWPARPRIPPGWRS